MLELEDLTKQIKNIALNSGAELIGIASAKQLEKGAPKGHRPSDLMLKAKSAIILACGRKLHACKTKRELKLDLEP